MNIGIEVITEAIDERCDAIRALSREVNEGEVELKRKNKVLIKRQEELDELLLLRRELEEK